MKKNVAILVFDDVEVLDFAGPFEVFALTDELQNHEPFHTFTFALAPGSVRARNGLKIVPDFTPENCPPPHILVIPGGAGTRPLLAKPALHEWLRVKSRKAKIVFSVCTGALVLAKAGLLDGLRVTTHHTAVDLLRTLAPKAEVDPSARFHDTGKVITSGGITAGIDASLHIVTRLLGAAATAATVKEMEYRSP